MCVVKPQDIFVRKAYQEKVSGRAFAFQVWGKALNHVVGIGLWKRSSVYMTINKKSLKVRGQLLNFNLILL